MSIGYLNLIFVGWVALYGSRQECRCVFAAVNCVMCAFDGTRLTQPTSTLRIGRGIFVHRAAVEDWTEFTELAFAEVFVEVDCPLLLFGGG